MKNHLVWANFHFCHFCRILKCLCCSFEFQILLRLQHSCVCLILRDKINMYFSYLKYVIFIQSKMTKYVFKNVQNWLNMWKHISLHICIYILCLLMLQFWHVFITTSKTIFTEWKQFRGVYGIWQGEKTRKSSITKGRVRRETPKTCWERKYAMGGGGEAQWLYTRRLNEEIPDDYTVSPYGMQFPY